MAERTSVVIPAHDAARYIAASLESVLTQTRAPDDVIVVDDGSTDETSAVVEGFGAPVRLVRQPHGGYASAVNRGVAEASGSMLAFQDADDLWVPDKLERQHDALDATRELDAVFGHLENFVDPGLSAETAQRYRVLPAMPSYQLQTMLVRRTAFDRVGALDARFGTAVTIDWISRFREAGLRSLMIDAVVTKRRIHDSNMGVLVGSEREDELLAVLRTHRRRMRSSGTT